MADAVCNSLVISYLNIHGQTGLQLDKQLQIEEFVKYSRSDIIHLQEIDIQDDTFNECNFIKSNFTVITNNAGNKYGTASLVKNDLPVENVMCDTAGRVIIFEISKVNFGNLYLPSGTDGVSRSNREKYCAEIIPQILVNRQTSGCLGGDFNCITNKQDATNNPESKMSPSLARLVKAFGWVDSFRVLNPNSSSFSRYYIARGNTGASRIDRQYNWGGLIPIQAEYTPVAFSDHLAHTVKVKVPDPLDRMCCPKSRPHFKVREEVARDKVFQDRVKEGMEEWDGVRQEGLPVLTWWEIIVKPGIRKIAMERSKEINRDKKSVLNLLLIRQAYLIKKCRNSYQGQGWTEKLSELLTVQSEIKAWYKQEAEKIKHQSRVDEFQSSEQTRIYHHEIHQKHLNKASILKLQTESGLLVGHDDCAKYLEDMVAKLLLYPAELDPSAQEILLDEIQTSVTDDDNKLLVASPTKEEVLSTLKEANLKAAPGTDGITSMVYKLCWDSLGDALTVVAKAKANGEKLPPSMRTSMMVFGTKPKKAKSLKPSDKRRINLLNSDFKLLEDLDARRFRKLTPKCISPVQYVASSDRRIHHGIGRARDAIFAASKQKSGCGIADTDFVAAFDWMVLSWVWKVLLKMGFSISVVNRIKMLYEDSITITVVNNKFGRVFKDMRGSLRQGGCASMEWFGFGIDPLLRYLEKRLQGIKITSLPVLGPSLPGQAVPLPPLEERFKLMAYCDDVKPSVTNMSEFLTVDRACSLFERSSGCKLHRDPSEGKCKFLPLGRWKGTLQQEDIPLPYMVISDSLEMVGVELRATWIQTRKVNGDIIQTRVANTINAWKSGKFMDLTCRPWSVNCYALSKVWFKCHTVDLRVADINSITSKIKSWLYQDQLEKPEEMVIYRPINAGGLGLHNVSCKAKASLIRTFLETAVNPSFSHSLYHSLLFRAHVLKDDTVSVCTPPYYSDSFFKSIRWVEENTPLNVATMSTAQWYRVLVEQEVTMVEVEGTPRDFIKCKEELLSPEIDWETTWRRARMKGLGSEATSFLWKMLHNILPTEARLGRILPNQSQNCKFCSATVNADLLHCFFYCEKTKIVGRWLLSWMSKQDSGVSAAGLLKLEFQVEESREMPVVWLIAQTLLYMWGVRANGNTVDLNTTRSVLEGRINLLRDTRFRNEYQLLKEIIEI